MSEATAGPSLPITGGCLCGAIRYAASAAPYGVRTCWCRLCQYLAAGSATVNLVFPADAVALTGTLATFERIADSGNHLTRGFCPSCGTQVTSQARERRDLLILRAGTLDDPSIAAPQSTIWAGAAPPWALIHADIPAHPAQAPPIA